MNDKELNKNVKKSLENFIKELATNPEKVFDNDKLQIKYNNVLKEKIKLQSNWNSLREWIETDNKRAKGYIERIRTSDLCHGDYPVEYFYAEKRKEITDYYLDKMNELEGVSDEKNM